MDITALAQALHDSAVSDWLRSSLKALPIIESIHVMAVAMVFGTILLVDLRLLGIRDTNRPFSRVFGELVRWTWLGFAVAVVTGVLLFVPNAPTYVINTAFRLKLAALACAGVNMAVFEFTLLKKLAKWDTAVPVPNGARIAGLASIVIWTSVIVFGRWIGFTKGYIFTPPEDPKIFEDLFNQGLDLLRQLPPFV